MKCLSANMATCLASNVSRSNLDELAETADKIQELSDRSCVHAPDVLTKVVEKLELLVPEVSSRPDDKQRPRSSKQSGISPKHQICYYHKIYGGNARKCQPGCKYPKTDTSFPQGNFTARQ
ncbi:unnamed protein product [Hymenolepis diminuta]|uniref:Uncharacterized protein n=1 Tax=Hymenolepis diminuta TaxID=6216 RepID=A0A564YB21_HYMDI|nr:unnamed protein product [Hymenolepis diminuta]